MAALTHPFVALGILSVGAGLGVAALAWLNRESRGARIYAALMVALTAWSALYVAQLLAPTVGAKRPWLVARHAVSIPVVVLFWLFAARYTDRSDLLSRRVLAPIVAVGVALVAIIVTNPAQVYWRSIALSRTAGIPVADIAFGPAFLVMFLYVLAVAGGGHYPVVATFLDSFSVYRKQLVALTAVGLFEFALLALFLSGHTTLLPTLNPWPDLQLITYGTMLVALVLGWSYFDADLFDIHPLARRTVLENMSDAVVVFEGDEVVTANANAADLLGRPDTADLLGDSFGEAVADVPAIREALADVCETETEVSVTVDGDQRDYDIRLSPIRDSTGRDVGRVVVARDITRRKAYERELERKNEFLDEFAGVVSHDIATPLNIIENKARLIEVTGDTDHAEDIYEATDRVQELVDELRDLAREGKRVGETTPVDLEPVAREAWESVESAEVTLTVDASGTVDADRGRLRQLLENLLQNAVDHSAPPEGAPGVLTDGSTAGPDVTVRVGTFPRGFYVEDDGSGIPEEERGRVFEQGFTTDEDSTGLGLAIVRRIAEGHGWTVTVTESDAGGARFEVRTND